MGLKSYERIFRCGQIWLVNFDPSFGHEYRKARPVLVVQSDEYESSSLLTVVPLSSQIAKAAELDVAVPKDRYNRLMADSLLKIGQISSFDKRRFIKLIGVVDDEVLVETENRVGRFLFQRKQKKDDPDGGTGTEATEGGHTVEEASSTRARLGPWPQKQ